MFLCCNHTISKEYLLENLDFYDELFTAVSEYIIKELTP
jgi:hypothetical protein